MISESSASGLSSSLRRLADQYDREVSTLLEENACLRSALMAHEYRDSGEGEFTRQDDECIRVRAPVCQVEMFHAMGPIHENGGGLTDPGHPIDVTNLLPTFNATFSTTSAVVRLAEERSKERDKAKEKSKTPDKVQRVLSFAQMRAAVSEQARPGRGVRLVEHHCFHLAVGFVIILNTLATAVEADLGDMEAPPYLIITDMFFSLFFFLEIVIRIMVYKSAFVFNDDWHAVAWNILESVLVMCSMVSTVLNLLKIDTGSTGAIVTIRMLRMFKVARVVRVFNEFRELRLLVDGIVKSFRVLLWSSVFLAIVLLVTGVFLTFEVGHGAWLEDLDDEETKQMMYEYWGTTARSMFTLYQVQTGDSWASAIARPIMRHQPMYGLVLGTYLAVINLCVLNVVVAIMVETVMSETMVESEEEKAKWAVDKAQKISAECIRVFTWAAAGDQTISREEWHRAMRDDDCQRTFANFNISTAMLEMLFDVVDVDGSGEVDLEEFIDGIQHGLREVRSMDINAIQVDLWRLSSSLTQQFQSLNSGILGFERSCCNNVLERISKLHTELDTLRGSIREGVVDVSWAHPTSEECGRKLTHSEPVLEKLVSQTSSIQQYEYC